MHVEHPLQLWRGNFLQCNLERTNDYLVLLQDKTDMEGDKMATIIRKQAETEMELRQSKKDLNKTAEKTHQVSIIDNNRQ